MKKKRSNFITVYVKDADLARFRKLTRGAARLGLSRSGMVCEAMDLWEQRNRRRLAAHEAAATRRANAKAKAKAKRKKAKAKRVKATSAKRTAKRT